MDKILLSPPIAFLIVLGATMLFAELLSLLSFKQKKQSEGTCKSYACGEDVKTNLMQPDYSQFFPFAFFFTILHVVALMIATVPVDNIGSLVMALIYLGGAAVAIMILFRK